MKRLINFCKSLITVPVEDSNPISEYDKNLLSFYPSIDGNSHYHPAHDEPSLFSDTPDVINQRWVAWYLKRNTNHGYVKMQQRAEEIKRCLAGEYPRHFDAGYIPQIVTGNPLVISFTWVIWYKYEFDCSFEEAYQYARLVTHRE